MSLADEVLKKALRNQSAKSKIGRTKPNTQEEYNKFLDEITNSNLNYLTTARLLQQKFKLSVEKTIEALNKWMRRTNG